MRIYLAFETAMTVFVSQTFPVDYSLTDQVRRFSRAVCANIAAAWRRRRCDKSFVRLNDAEADAGTQTWLEFAVTCGYIEREKAQRCETYDLVSELITMMHADAWTLGKT